MGARVLDRMSWPEVQAEIEAGRRTVVVALGATEQHAHHMPLATDALIGDELARRVAERIDALLAPTLRVGCSEHHVGFPGTMSLGVDTYHAVIGDLVGSLLKGGFERVVLVPTHGGNFGPLAEAVERLPAGERVHVVALTDLGALFEVALAGEREHGVPLGEGGLHAGEWETSMLMAIHPELVHMDRARAGYTGDMQSAVQSMFEGGVASISPNGAIGDPARASAAHGERYWEIVEELVLERVQGQASGGSPGGS